MLKSPNRKYFKLKENLLCLQPGLMVEIIVLQKDSVVSITEEQLKVIPKNNSEIHLNSGFYWESKDITFTALTPPHSNVLLMANIFDFNKCFIEVDGIAVRALFEKDN